MRIITPVILCHFAVVTYQVQSKYSESLQRYGRNAINTNYFLLYVSIYEGCVYQTQATRNLYC